MKDKTKIELMFIGLLFLVLGAFVIGYYSRNYDISKAYYDGKQYMTNEINEKYNCYNKPNLTDLEFDYIKNESLNQNYNLTTGSFYSNSSLIPKNIIFIADEIVFADNNLSISWTEEGLLGWMNFTSFNELEFNVGNKSFTYVLVGVSE